METADGLYENKESAVVVRRLLEALTEVGLQHLVKVGAALGVHGIEE